jgi:hypothetical protein
MDLLFPGGNGPALDAKRRSVINRRAESLARQLGDSGVDLVHEIARRIWKFGALALSPICLCVAQAQRPGAPDDPQEQPGEENIIVTGTRKEQQAVRNYVERITVETDDQIARFATPVCPASFGLPPDYNAVIASRIREVARAAGIPTRSGNCNPNVVVIVAAEADRFLSALRRQRAMLFTGLTARQREALARGGDAVRSWQVIETRGADGRIMENVSHLLKSDGTMMYIGQARQLSTAVQSRLARTTRQDLALSFVLFDLDAVEGFSLTQIADHAAMRALARTRIDAVNARRSILGLLENGSSSASSIAELTQWDAAYLRALYSTNNTISATQQRSNIARMIRDELDRGPGGASQQQASGEIAPTP